MVIKFSLQPMKGALLVITIFVILMTKMLMLNISTTAMVI